MGDLLHVRSAVTGVDGDALLLGHELIESASGTLCTTLEQRTAPLGAAQRRKAEAFHGSWASPPEPPRSPTTEGFVFQKTYGESSPFGMTSSRRAWVP